MTKEEQEKHLRAGRVLLMLECAGCILRVGPAGETLYVRPAKLACDFARYIGEEKEGLIWLLTDEASPFPNMQVHGES